MNKSLSMLRACGLSVLVGLTFTVGVGLTPAFAQSLGQSFSIGRSAAEPPARGPARQHEFNRQRGYDRRCMSDREIRRGLQDYGFSDINITSSYGRNGVKLQALFDDNWYYSMAADRCTGFVSHVSPLYPAADDNSGYYDNGSGYGGRSNDFGGYGY